MRNLQHRPGIARGVLCFILLTTVLPSFAHQHAGDWYHSHGLAPLSMGMPCQPDDDSPSPSTYHVHLLFFGVELTLPLPAANRTNGSGIIGIADLIQVDLPDGLPLDTSLPAWSSLLGDISCPVSEDAIELDQITLKTTAGLLRC